MPPWNKIEKSGLLPPADTPVLLRLAVSQKYLQRRGTVVSSLVLARLAWGTDPWGDLVPQGWDVFCAAASEDDEEGPESRMERIRLTDAREWAPIP